MKNITPVLMGILLILNFGCATPPTKGPSEKEKLVETYLQTAQARETEGKKVEAAEQYKLALTVEPQHPLALEKAAELDAELIRMAEEQYQAGMAYHRQGKYGLARQAYLSALTYWPEHTRAAEMLTRREKKKTRKYIFHIIRPGENLARLAKQYYGDYKKYTIIAEYNNLEDAAQISVGQKIMIPEIAGGTPDGIEKVDSDQKEKFIVHTLMYGESLSKLAQKYYGDYKRFDIIAEYNDMEDATRVKIGQEIKIPVIEGLPFYVDKAETTAAVPVEEPAPLPEPVADDSLQEAEEQEQYAAETDTEDGSLSQVVIYRDQGISLYNKKKYQEAIFELHKVVNADSGDEQARQYLALAYLRRGEILIDQKNISDAKKQFEAALQYDADCAPCRDGIKQCDAAVAAEIKTAGINLFKQKQYTQAILQFEQVLKIQPDNPAALDYLSRSHFQSALILYNAGDYLNAGDRFEMALQYDSTCRRCRDYIKKTLDTYLEIHYNRGLTAFGKEDLALAIKEWELVAAVKPSYKKVDPNLKKAKTLFERLEKIKLNSQTTQ
ncbi:MAG: tetratricopeptide repeat protein [Deltaproteobacteria bacterium]|nr:tetratricopeptide repeat protein [Deltaproteobacteria bacterium]